MEDKGAGAVGTLGHSWVVVVASCQSGPQLGTYTELSMELPGLPFQQGCWISKAWVALELGGSV